MKMWKVRKGARGTLFVFDEQGRITDTIRNRVVREDRDLDDGEVLDHVHIHNNERQGMSSMAFFPRHLYPAPRKLILELVQREHGAAIIGTGKDGRHTYVMVLPMGSYECMC